MTREPYEKDPWADFWSWFFIALLAANLLFSCGCGLYMLSKMAGLCSRNGGVAESEVDGSYIHVKCMDGTHKSRHVE